MKKPSGTPTPRAESTTGYDRMNPVDPATWKHLLDVFREHPANVAVAAETCGVEVRVARKAWSAGWSGGYPAIQGVLLDEQVQGRAAAEREGAERAREVRVQAAITETAGLQAAQAAVVKGRKEEAQVIQFARANVLLTLNATTKIVNALGVLGDKVVQQLAAQGTIDPKLYVTLLRGTAQTIVAGVSAGQTVMEMERLHLGEPTKILGLAPANARDHKEVLRELEETVESLKHAESSPSRSPIALGDKAITPAEDPDGL